MSWHGAGTTFADMRAVAPAALLEALCRTADDLQQLFHVDICCVDTDGQVLYDTNPETNVIGLLPLPLQTTAGTSGLGWDNDSEEPGVLVNSFSGATVAKTWPAAAEFATTAELPEPSPHERVLLLLPVVERRHRLATLLASYVPAENPRATADSWSAAAAAKLLHALAGTLQQQLRARQQEQELEELSEKLLESYEEIALLHRLGQHFSLERSAADVLRNSCHELRSLLGDARTVGCLALSPGNSPDPDNETFLRDGPAPLIEVQARELLQAYQERKLPWGQPWINNEADILPRLGLGKMPGRLLAAPLCYRSETLGLLLAVGGADQASFDSRDAQMSGNVAVQTAAHWKSLLMFGELRRLLLSLVSALVSAIDAKDPYTSGHSERVALVARAIAEAMHLDHKQVDDIYLAGLLHDIGKIGIREEVLRKPGKLTDEEWDHLRQHPAIGAKILEPISPIGQVIPGVRFHHESYNGKGYPAGLEGENIPLMARILAVADAFDAMATQRPYRQPLEEDEVFRRLRQGQGSQWDAVVIDVFLGMVEQGPFLASYRQRRDADARRIIL